MAHTHTHPNALAHTHLLHLLLSLYCACNYRCLLLRAAWACEGNALRISIAYFCVPSDNAVAAKASSDSDAAAQSGRGSAVSVAYFSLPTFVRCHSVAQIGSKQTVLWPHMWHSHTHTHTRTRTHTHIRTPTSTHTRTPSPIHAFTWVGRKFIRVWKSFGIVAAVSLPCLFTLSPTLFPSLSACLSVFLFYSKLAYLLPLPVMGRDPNECLICTQFIIIKITRRATICLTFASVVLVVVVLACC